MSFRHALAACLLGVVLMCNCVWDLGQFVFHPSVEQRVTESLSGEIKIPEPVAVNPDSFRFAMFGDPQVHSDLKHRLGRFAQDVEPNGIDFFCVLGDLTHDATAIEVMTIKAGLDSVGIPYYATIGNHDLYQREGWAQFKENFGPTCYSVVIGDKVKLIFLDTADGTIGKTQFAWLETELDDAGQHIKVVGTHFPCYDGITPCMWRMASAAERYKLQYLLQKHGAYALVSGHIHGWRYTQVQDVHHFIVGTMAPGGLDYGNHGYLLLTFAQDTLSWDHIEF